MHGAFDNPLKPAGARRRESAECIVLLIYPNLS